MQTNNVTIAKAYYQAASRKDLTEMTKYLHPDVLFITPLATLHGREAVIQAACGFVSMATSLDVRAAMGAENQVMLMIDAVFADPIGKFPTAGLYTFEDGLMKKIELFYDPRPMLVEKDKIFSR